MIIYLLLLDFFIAHNDIKGHKCENDSKPSLILNFYKIPICIFQVIHAEREIKQKSLEDLEVAAEKIMTNITSNDDLKFKNEIAEGLESVQDR